MNHKGVTTSEAGRVLSHALLVYGHVTGKNKEEVHSTLFEMGIETRDIIEYSGKLENKVLELSNNTK